MLGVLILLYILYLVFENHTSLFDRFSRHIYPRTSQRHIPQHSHQYGKVMHGDIVLQLGVVFLLGPHPLGILNQLGLRLNGVVAVSFLLRGMPLVGKHRHGSKLILGKLLDGKHRKFHNHGMEVQANLTIQIITPRLVGIGHLKNLLVVGNHGIRTHQPVVEDPVVGVPKQEENLQNSYQ